MTFLQGVTMQVFIRVLTATKHENYFPDIRVGLLFLS